MGMFPTKRRMRLGHRLLAALILAVTAPSIVVATLLIRSDQRTHEAEMFADAKETTEVAADTIERFVSAAESALDGAAVTQGLAEMSRTEQQAALRALLSWNDAFESLRVVGMHGGSMAVSRPGEPAAPERIPEDAAVEVRQGRVYVGQVMYDAPGRPRLVMAAGIRSASGDLAGTLVAAVGLDPVQGFIDMHAVEASRGVYLYVLDRRGRVMAYPSRFKGMIGALLTPVPMIREAVSGATDRGFTRGDVYADPAGRRVVGAYRRLGVLGWTIVLQQPAQLVFSPELGRVATALGWTVAFVLLFGGIGLQLVRMITQPIEDLRRGAEAIGSGDLSYRVRIESGDEFSYLAEALNTMAESLEVSRRRLRQEHDRAVTSAREARTLYRVSQSLVSTLELKDRLDVIAENLATVCHTNKVVIWLVEGRRLLPYAFHGLTEAEHSLFSAWEIDVERVESMTRTSPGSRQPVVIADASADERLPRDLMERLDVRSMLVAPFVLRGEPIGFAITYEVGAAHRFTKYQINLATAVAAQGAVAIENARAYERERMIAETLQRSLLPSVPPSIGEFEIADVYAPALDEAEVGGDFYDLIVLNPNQVAFVIADISGKGLSAAVYTAMVKYTTRAHAMQEIPPHEVLARLNVALCRYTGEQSFVTMFYGVLDTTRNQLSYANGGHELPLLHSGRRGLCQRLAVTGMALGVVEEAAYRTESIEFDPGDVLFLYTDGASDVRRGGQFMGIDGLEEVFCSASEECDAPRIISSIERSIREFASGSLHDDVALMVVRRVGDRQTPTGPQGECGTP